MPESGQSNREQRRRGGSPLRSRNGVPAPDVRGVASHADEPMKQRATSHHARLRALLANSVLMQSIKVESFALTRRVRAHRSRSFMVKRAFRFLRYFGKNFSRFVHKQIERLVSALSNNAFGRQGAARDRTSTDV
jgi:hypothetical protein